MTELEDIEDIRKRVKGLIYRIDKDLYVVIEWMFDRIVQSLEGNDKCP